MIFSAEAAGLHQYQKKINRVHNDDVHGLCVISNRGREYIVSESKDTTVKGFDSSHLPGRVALYLAPVAVVMRIASLIWIIIPDAKPPHFAEESKCLT